MFMYMYMNNLMFILSCVMFTFYYKHILLTLISLEFMMVNLMMNFYIVINLLNLNVFFTSFFLSIMICEGVAGLSVMVYMIRLSGNDYMNLLNILKW